MIKCCIFDLDGTLLNTLPTITHYVNMTLAEDGLAPISEEECRGFIGNGAAKLIQRAYALRKASNEDGSGERLRRYMDHYDSDPLYLTRPYPGIPELLSRLKEGGIRVGVVSNKQHSSTVSIVAEMLSGLVDGCIGGKEGIPLKPSPVSSLELVSALGCTPTETAFIGDSDVDMLTGRALGAKCFGVLWGYMPKALAECDSDGLARDAQELLCMIGGDYE